MNNPWYQIWIKCDGDVVQKVQACEPILMQFNSLPCAPNGTPVLNKDGTIEIRSYNEVGFRMTKEYLRSQGFSIERETENYE